MTTGTRKAREHFKQGGIGNEPVGSTNPVELIEVKEILRTLWRRRGVIVGTMLFIVSVAVLVVQQLTPKYTASTLLTLQTRKEALVDIQAVMSGLSMDASVIRTELDIISSRRLVGKLVEKMNLTRDPEFNPFLRTPSPLSTLLNPHTYLSPEWLMAIGLSVEEDEVMTVEDRAAREFAATVDGVKSQLSVTNTPMSYTIEIAFDSEDPKKAARLANSLAELYLTNQLEAKFEATKRATDWLSGRIGDLRARVLEAEQTVQAYREAHQIIQSGAEGTVSEQQLAELNVQLINARTELAGIQARYDQVKAQLGRANRGESLSEVLRSPLIQTLSSQEAQVRRKKAEISKRYGSRHPETIAVESELRDIRSKIREEIEKVLKSVESELQVTRARVATLSRNLETLKAENAQIDKASVDLRELEREAESSRVLLETFLSRFKETSNQDDLQQPDVRIISKAEYPTTPSSPRKKLILAVATVLSLLVGLLLIILLEALDNGFRALEHLERTNHVAGLGMIPKLTAFKLKGLKPFDYAIKNPASAFSESLRSIHTALMFGPHGDNRPKTILVTSSLPAEGKTTFCLSLARLLSKAGANKVLYIEGDLHRPQVKKSLLESRGKAPPVSEYLSGIIADWSECVINEDGAGVDILSADRDTPNPQTLLESERMRRLLAEAAERYDLVLIDAPPVLVVSDAIVLSHFVDMILLVVKWESTAREAVKSALASLRKAGAPIGGAILTQVDVKKHAQYGYGDYGSYYGRYGNYYTG